MSYNRSPGSTGGDVCGDPSERPTPASSTAPSPSDTAWGERRFAARLVGAAAIGIPLLAGVGTSFALGSLLPVASTRAEVFLRVAMILVTSTAVVVLGRRATARLAPLQMLLRLSLAFPDTAPRRLRVALRAPSVRDLEQRLTRLAEKDGEEPQEVAEQIVAMVAVLSAHHRLTRGHSERVRAYAELLGRELDLPEADLQRLKWAALLHDLGKIKVPVEILDKKGRPDADEWKVIAAHPAEGGRLAAALEPWLGPWVGGITEHHERFDGTGYPNGLAGRDISLAGRIVAVADSFETMTAIRSYKTPMPIELARRELVESASSHFDPQVVRAFLNIGLDRLRKTVGVATWLPAQAVNVLQALGSSPQLVAAPAQTAMAASSAAALTLSVAPLRELVIVPEPDDETAAIAEGQPLPLELPTDPTTPVTVTVTVTADGATTIDEQTTTTPSTTTTLADPIPTTTSTAASVPASTSTTTPSSTAANAPATTTTTAAPTTARPTTTSAPTTNAPTTNAPTTAAPTITSAPTPTTAPAVGSAPSYNSLSGITWVGDGRTLQWSPDIDDGGLAATCTLWLAADPASTASGPCDAPLQILVPLHATAYTARVQATNAAGSSPLAGNVFTSAPKALTVDAASHWPCPGLFCGPDSRAYSSTSLFSVSQAVAAGTQVEAFCWTTGGTIDTSFGSSGTETSDTWLAVTGAPYAWMSALSFPTPGETAIEHLPPC